MRVITLTLNPCLDITLRSDGRIDTQSGGKGINVARVLSALNVDVLAIAPIGGRIGDAVIAACAREGINLLPINISGETRRVITRVDCETLAQQVDFRPGPDLTEDECANILRAVKDNLHTCDTFALCGSASCRRGAILAADALRLAKSMGVETLLDSSNAALLSGIGAAPDAIKPNLVELSQLANREAGPEDAREILDKYCIKYALITLGERGAMYISKERTQFCPAPKVKTINPVGSGDSFTAAWIYSRDLKYACAAGAANAAMFPAARIGKADIDRVYLLQDMIISTYPPNAPTSHPE